MPLLLLRLNVFALRFPPAAHSPCCQRCCAFLDASSFLSVSFQLSYAQSLKRPEQELAVIHVSLAATFGDLKDYAQAVHHYRAELAFRQGNPLEVSQTRRRCTSAHPT